jgi:hypothetical protein
VAEGPDPFADPITRRALIAGRPPSTRGRNASPTGAPGPPAPEPTA